MNKLLFFGFCVINHDVVSARVHNRRFIKVPYVVFDIPLQPKSMPSNITNNVLGERHTIRKSEWQTKPVNKGGGRHETVSTGVQPISQWEGSPHDNVRRKSNSMVLLAGFFGRSISRIDYLIKISQ